MAITVDFDIDLRRVEDLLERMEREFQAGPASAAVTEIVNRIQAKAKRSGYGFTDRTGTLRRSINTFGPRTISGGVMAGVGASARYAPFVEHGSGGRYSFLRRAARELGPEYVSIVERHIAEWIKASLR